MGLLQDGRTPPRPHVVGGHKNKSHSSDNGHAHFIGTPWSLARHGALGEVVRELGKQRKSAAQDHRRKKCLFVGCEWVHLKGSDFCFGHDDGKPPRTRGG